MMAMSSPFCLACGQETLPNNRRLLSSETSSTVRQAWQDLLTEKLEQMLLEVNFEPMIRGNPPGCVCKKCFMAVKSFYDRKTQLLKNLDAAINKMPCNARPIPSSAELEGTPTTRGRKRACHCLSDHEEHRRLSSFNRLSFPSTATSTSAEPVSPGVQASGLSICNRASLLCCFMTDNVNTFHL